MTSDSEQLHTWWRMNEWRHLVPVIRDITESSVHRQARRIDADTVDDVTAWVITKCWALAYIPDDPRAFIAACARHRTIDVMTKHRRHRDISLSNYAQDVIDVRLTSPLTAIIQAEDRAQLYSALETLHESYREVLICRDIYRQSITVIAQRLAVSEGSVKMRLVRARRQLAVQFHRMARQLHSPPRYCHVAQCD